MKKLLLFLFFVVSFINLEAQNGFNSEIILSSSVLADGEEGKVNIFPNPAITSTNIALNGFHKNIGIKELYIFSILGNQVHQSAYASSPKKLNLNVQKLQKGRYLIKILLSDDTFEIASLIKR